MRNLVATVRLFGGHLLCMGLVVAVLACGSTETSSSPEVSSSDVQPDGVQGEDVLQPSPDTLKEDVTSAEDIAVVPDATAEIDVSAEDISEASDTFPAEDILSDSTEDVASDIVVPQDVSPSDVTPEPDTVVPTPLKVLFIGNSYTSVNGLASLVAQTIGAQGWEVETQAITIGGAWLENHLETPSTVETIVNGEWTHVVLQEQSYLPLVAPQIFQEAATGLAVIIHEAGAIPVFFETWARKEGNSLYQGDLDGFTPLMMQAALRGAYTQAAEANDGVFAPVGDAWELSLAEHPEIDLHSSDGSHPAMAGSYLAACVFYGILTGGEPIDLTFVPSGVSEEDAVALQAMAKSVLP